MMRILAIDTSVGSGSVAAADDQGIAQRPLGPAGGHARVLTSAIVDVAADRGWGRGAGAIKNLGPTDVIAVVTGPGSFTGLRVGVTAAKALAWATGARLVGVSGFEACARRVAPRPAGPITVAYDAGRGEIYAATVDVSPVGPTITCPTLMPAAAWIDALPAGTWLTGPGLEPHAERLLARGDLEIAAAEIRSPSADGVAAIARDRAAAGLFDDPLTLVPEYLRPSYAEERKPLAEGPAAPTRDRQP